jgi:hypothetical protein
VVMVVAEAIIVAIEETIESDFSIMKYKEY